MYTCVYNSIHVMIYFVYQHFYASKTTQVTRIHQPSLGDEIIGLGREGRAERRTRPQKGQRVLAQGVCYNRDELEQIDGTGRFSCIILIGSLNKCKKKHIGDHRGKFVATHTIIIHNPWDSLYGLQKGVEFENSKFIRRRSFRIPKNI